MEGGFNMHRVYYSIDMYNRIDMYINRNVECSYEYWNNGPILLKMCLGGYD
jgi:hypothetical protein